MGEPRQRHVDVAPRAELCATNSSATPLTDMPPSTETCDLSSRRVTAIAHTRARVAYALALERGLRAHGRQSASQMQGARRTRRDRRAPRRRPQRSCRRQSAARRLAARAARRRVRQPPRRLLRAATSAAAHGANAAPHHRAQWRRPWRRRPASAARGRLGARRSVDGASASLAVRVRHSPPRARTMCLSAVTSATPSASAAVSAPAVVAAVAGCSACASQQRALTSSVRNAPPSRLHSEWRRRSAPRRPAS